MSGSHLLIVVVVLAVLFLGPAKLPHLGRSMGDAIRGFKKGLSGEDEGEIDVTNSAREKLSTPVAPAVQTQAQVQTEVVRETSPN